MLFLLDREGLERVNMFFTTSHVLDTRAIIHQRFNAAFLRQVAEAEADWLAALP